LQFDREETANILKAHGIIPTRQRVEIGSILLAPGQHLSAAQLLDQVNQDSEAVSKATIYNTVALFARKGLVRKVIINSRNVFYDSNTTHHHHFYNVSTGVPTDIPEEQIIISQLPELPDGAIMERVEVTIRLRDKSP
jgi:Fur family iron response transcriptional regulator